MNKYKTFEELKEELGDKFEDYMYKANIELLNKLDKIKEEVEYWGYEEKYNDDKIFCKCMKKIHELLEEVE